MTANDMLLSERHDAYLWLTLNRPDKANALAVGLMEAVTAELAKGAQDETVRAILLTGAGERVFCAGADVREQPADGDMPAHRKRRSVALAALLDAVMNTPKPVIAVMNGIASGGGAMLALLADARVAVDTAEIAMPEINLGMATFVGMAVLEGVGGRALAADLAQTGRRMPAREALTRGLVSAVVPRADLAAAALHLASTLAGKDLPIFAAHKAWLNREIKAALTEARAEQQRHRDAHKK